MNQELLQAGQTFGPYEVLRKLGEGSMGTVYLGRHRDRCDVHAIKVILPQLAATPYIVKRFQMEAQIASRLAHPNIIHVLGSGVERGLPYLAMPYVEGDTLDRVYRRGGLTLHQGVRYTYMIANALHHTHRSQIIHRDVKPGNIMVDPRRVARLMDFGLVWDLTRGREGQGDTSSEDADALTVGTPQYMPPEQWKCSHVDVRSDLFALGVTLFHVITGGYPYMGYSIAEVCSKILAGRPTPALEVDPGLDPALAEILDRPVQSDPRLRYQTGDEFARALADWWRAHPPPPWEGLPAEIDGAAVPVHPEVGGQPAPPRPPVPAAPAPVAVGAALPVTEDAVISGAQRESLISLVSKLEQIPALPLVYHEVRRLTAVRTTDARTVVEALEKDPGLCGKVLKLANTAIFGFRGKITNLHLAVSLLGNGHILGMTSALAILKHFRRSGDGKFDPKQFWWHSILTGCCVAELNGYYKYEIRDDLFTFGLLHDIGKIAVYENLPDKFDRIIFLYQKGVPYRQAEIKILGADHTVVGALVAQGWKLPEDYVEVIRSHHAWDGNLKTATDKRKFLVFLGNIIAHMIEARQAQGKYPTMKPPFLEKFRFTQVSIEGLADRAAEKAKSLEENLFH